VAPNLRDYGNGLVVKKAYSAQKGRVVAVITVPVEFGELLEQQGDVVADCRAVPGFSGDRPFA